MKPKKWRIRTEDWGTRQIDIGRFGEAIELMITEIHHQENGSLSGKGNFMFLIERGPHHFFTQISLAFLSKHLRQIGYELRRIP